MSKLLINIEGNIGAGKSTFTGIISKNIQNSDLVDEPIDVWLNIKDNNENTILDNFYQDKKRWSYTFQNFAYVTRMMKIEDAVTNSNKKYIFLDRSLDTDLFVFSKMLYDDGCMNSIERTIYEYWNNFYFKYVKKNHIEKTIYLRTSPDICLQRIIKRGREAEKNIDISYLEKLHLYHEQWLLNKENIFVIDCNIDFENNLEYQNEIINKINNFITS
jgi:deoxyadenosine/deoxycytidine kinase